MTKSKRKSNIELLRIIAMILIIAHHFALHGKFTFPTSLITPNRLWIQFIKMGGTIGINLFVLISGYFLIKSQNIKIDKIIKFWLQIFIYSIVLYGIFTTIGFYQFSIKELVKHLLPITFGEWWFASTYFVLYILSPFLNKLLLSLSKKDYKLFILILTIFWSVIPTLTGQKFLSDNLLWFIYLYSLSGYLRLHYNFRYNAKKYLLYSLSITLLTFLTVIIFDIIGMKYKIFAEHSTYFYDKQRIPILVLSVLLFLGFSKIDLQYNKLINIISSTTFGIYLIHDNSYVRNFLWISFFKDSSHEQDKFLIPYSISVILLVFIVCSFIEFIRQYFFESLYSNKLPKNSKKI